MLVAQKKITVKEFLHLDFEDENAYYELINGEIVRKSSPSVLHQEVVLKLAFRMKAHAKKNNLGRVFIAPLDVFLNEENLVQPDIFFISNENSQIIDEKDGIIGVPDLMVEVISPSSIRRDRVDKKNIYGKVGVKEYWLIDPAYQTIEVYKNENAEMELVEMIVEDGQVVSSVIKEFSLELKDIF